MTKPRSHYVDAEHAQYYHISSRCVRRAWLLGKDPLTGQNHDHRKAIFLNRLKHLSRFFAVEIMGYALMSNHFHIVLRYDPKEASTWSDEEVARRWCAAFNGKRLDRTEPAAAYLEEFDTRQTQRYHAMLLDDDRLARSRRALGSLSDFMQHLKQPFSRWVNRSEGCKGTLWEARFYSGALLDETDLLACMAYVDLNPVEAGMARNLKQAKNTSIHDRLIANRFNSDELDAYLAPLWENEDGSESETVTSELESTRRPNQLSCTLREYTHQLTLAVVYLTQPNSELPQKVSHWMARLLNRERNRRAASAFFDYT